MQEELFYDDLSDKKVLIGISGGINSAGLLCYLASVYPIEFRPKEIYLFYAHFSEHSPDTGRFAIACIRYALNNFSCVHWKITFNSVLRFFMEKKFIPHPMFSPCSEHLKYIPMQDYRIANNIDYDLIGFVKTERSRINRQIRKGIEYKKYPIAHLSDIDCLLIVDREIGWHPMIYDISNGKHGYAFQHNNCLPCKNMSAEQIRLTRKYYPEYMKKADKLAAELGSYWGREDTDGACGYCNFS